MHKVSSECCFTICCLKESCITEDIVGASNLNELLDILSHLSDIVIISSHRLLIINGYFYTYIPPEILMHRVSYSALFPKVL